MVFAPYHPAVARGLNPPSVVKGEKILTKNGINKHIKGKKNYDESELILLYVKFMEMFQVTKYYFVGSLVFCS